MKRYILFLLAFTSLTTFSQESSFYNLSRAQKVIKEKQHIADQGNGYYLNPIMPGNYGDPSIIRVDKDYYMAFSDGDGFTIWHSRDIINWEPLLRHKFKGEYSMTWAIDLQYINGKFYIYMPINNFPGKTYSAFGNFVTIADKPEGPWCEPINLDLKVIDKEGYSAIDPGFIQTPDGKKYLYVSDGYYVTLNDDGTKATSEPKRVYEGWLYPEEWNVECMCLESPKLFFRDGYYFLVSAQGGTSGPSTAHMTVVARSKTPIGPWENSPYNPITHTYSNDEKWWHQGHGTIFNAPDGTWWTIYHARLNGYQEIGRQCLLMPVDWTVDGWPVIKWSLPSSALLPAPAGENVGTGLPISDNFKSSLPGLQWDYKLTELNNFKSGDGKLVIDAAGTSHKEARAIRTEGTNMSYEVTVEVFCNDAGAWGGIDLGTDGLMTNGETTTFSEAAAWRMIGSNIPVKNKGHVYLKIKNYRKDLSFYCSDDGINWKSFGKGIRSNGSYSIRLFAWGKGKVSFSNFRYKGLE